MADIEKFIGSGQDYATIEDFFNDCSNIATGSTDVLIGTVMDAGNYQVHGALQQSVIFDGMNKGISVVIQAHPSIYMDFSNINGSYVVLAADAANRALWLFGVESKLSFKGVKFLGDNTVLSNDCIRFNTGAGSNGASFEDCHFQTTANYCIGTNDIPSDQVIDYYNCIFDGGVVAAHNVRGDSVTLWHCLMINATGLGLQGKSTATNAIINDCAVFNTQSANSDILNSYGVFTYLATEDGSAGIHADGVFLCGITAADFQDFAGGNYLPTLGGLLQGTGGNGENMGLNSKVSKAVVTITGSIPDSPFTYKLDDESGNTAYYGIGTSSSGVVTLTSIPVPVGTTLKGYVDDTASVSTNAAYLEVITEAK